MKTFIAMLALVSASAFAQTQRSNCGPTEEVFNYFEKSVKEKVIFVAKNDDDIFLTFWFNSETKEGTIIKSSISRKISCIVDSFTHGKFVGTL